MEISDQIYASSYTNSRPSVKRDFHLRFRGLYALASLVCALTLLPSAHSGQLPRPMETQSAPALALGKTAPVLSAQDIQGKPASVHDGKAKWTVVVFLSTRCPCTARYLTRLNTILQQFDRRSVRLVGINSNANELPEDATAFARNQQLRFPLLKDTDGSVARALRPQATPEIFILDTQRRVRYHGAIDDSVDGDNIRHFYLRDALTRLTAGKSLSVPETKAIGCAIFLHKK